MENVVEQKLTKLETQSRVLANGLDQIGAAIGITQNTPAKFRLEIAALTAAILAHKGAVTERNNRYDVGNSVKTTARTFLTLFRDSLKPEFGTRYNTDWNRIGLFGSLKISTSMEELVPLLGAANGFLTENPGFEVANK